LTTAVNISLSLNACTAIPLTWPAPLSAIGWINVVIIFSFSS
jgi:hypothetical protein